MSAKLCHKALAETHNLSVALALGVKVRTALAAAHRQCCKAVLEDLLKAEELDDTEIYGGVKSDTALVRSDCRVELNSETSVYLSLAVVVYPGYTEHNLSFRLNDSLKYACVNEILSFFNYGLKALENFCYCLNEFGLACISFLNCFEQVDKILIF